MLFLGVPEDEVNIIKAWLGLAQLTSDFFLVKFSDVVYDLISLSVQSVIQLSNAVS